MGLAKRAGTEQKIPKSSKPWGKDVENEKKRTIRTTMEGKKTRRVGKKRAHTFEREREKWGKYLIIPSSPSFPSGLFGAFSGGLRRARMEMLTTVPGLSLFIYISEVSMN